MAIASLDEAYDKIRWARHHLKILRPQIEAFEQRDDHRITVDVNSDSGEYVFHVFELEPPDPDWGLIIGDCVHNARAALDYLMVRLVCRITGADPKDVDDIQFPIYGDRGRFASSVGELRKVPALSGYLARVEELQPYNAQNASIWGVGPGGLPLWPLVPSGLSRLSTLDNIDKHRAIHVAWQGGAVDRAQTAFPVEFRLLGSTATYGSLGNGAEIGRWTFHAPLPAEWEPTQMEMKRAFPIEVSLGDPSPFKGVLEVLPLCIGSVEAVLGLFKPVFDHGAPPLPVTATLA